jgi:L-erythro-3,5-diaminohexanoate dehydrogenase
MKRVGPTGNVVCQVRRESQVQELLDLGVAHKVIVADAHKPVDLTEKAKAVNGGREFDIAISCVNVESCEMAAILPVRDGGQTYFFSMATSFTKAALGAEGIGKDITMIVGNGYTKDHAEITLWELRENEKIRDLFNKKYV